MRISLDAGALCSSGQARFGTYTFTKNFIEAFGRYDPRNEYMAYTFCDIHFTKYKNIHAKKLPEKLWMSYHVTAHELMEPNDIFLGLSQAVPLASKSRIFLFSHGLSFLYFKDLYKKDYERLKKQLEVALRSAELIFVTSEKMKEELHVRYDFDNAIVISPGIPFDMTDELKMLTKYSLPCPNYFLFVGMNHPIKRVGLLVDHFNSFRSKKKYSSFGLFLVGDHKEFHNPDHGVYVYDSIEREQLRYMYKNATGYLVTSHYESFHFPALEALSQNCPVIGYDSAIIPELRPFCMVAHDQREFVYWMEHVALHTTPMPDLNGLTKRFSWEQSVRTISDHYQMRP